MADQEAWKRKTEMLQASLRSLKDQPESGVRKRLRRRGNVEPVEPPISKKTFKPSAQPYSP